MPKMIFPFAIWIIQVQPLPGLLLDNQPETTQASYVSSWMRKIKANSRLGSYSQTLSAGLFLSAKPENGELRDLLLAEDFTGNAVSGLVGSFGEQTLWIYEESLIHTSLVVTSQYPYLI